MNRVWEYQKTIHDYENNEKLINEALGLALAEPTPDQSIDALLKYIGNALHSERVFIFEECPDHTFCNTYEWCAEDVIPQIHNLQSVEEDALKIWYESFYEGENVIIKDIEAIKDSNPKAYEYLKPQEIHSIVVSPLVSNGTIIGFYGVDNPPQEFMNHISGMFMILGQFIVSIIRRRNLVRKLEQLSYYDQLTGARNRHYMNEFIANVDRNQSIGIVYCDVTGLKRINDMHGHLEGDDLLIRAYRCLSDHFPKDSIFRIGGDEFLAMKSGVTEEDMHERVSKLKKDMPKYDIHLALGCAWSSACNGQISELMKIADKRMYADKDEYYKDNPDMIWSRGNDRK